MTRVLAPVLASVASATMFAGLIVLVFAIPHDAPRGAWLVALMALGLIMLYAEIAAAMAQAFARGGSAPGFGEYLMCGCAAAACAALAPVWVMLLVLVVAPMLMPRRRATLARAQ